MDSTQEFGKHFLAFFVFIETRSFEFRSWKCITLSTCNCRVRIWPGLSLAFTSTELAAGLTGTRAQTGPGVARPFGGAVAEWQVPYISEITYGGDINADFIEVAAEQEIDLSGWSVAIYNPIGNVKAVYTLGSPVNVFGGHAAYLIDQSDAGFKDILSNEAIALLDDTGAVIQFVSFGMTTITAAEGPATGETSQPIGVASNPAQSLRSSDGGATYHTSNSPQPGIVPCFGPGTMIATPKGPRPVEALKVGDMVSTPDSGDMPIRWIAHRPVERGAGGNAAVAPVLIRKDTFAPGLPERDLILSPNHRVLLGHPEQFSGLLAGPAFVPAKALEMLPGVRRMRGRKKIDWFHFALDRHAVVRAEGLLVESLLLGTMIMRGLSDLERRRLARIFPGAPTDTALNGPMTYPELTAVQARRLLKIRKICGLFKAPPQNRTHRPSDREIAFRADLRQRIQ